VLYLWRHDDRKPEEEDDDEYWEEWIYHQLVAISQAKALPQPKQQPTNERKGADNDDEGDNDNDDDDDDDDDDAQAGYDSYYSSYDQDYQATAGQVWHRLPWADIFDRFIRRGCSSQVRGTLACGGAVVMAHSHKGRECMTHV
jgi:hypothetical protein